MKVPWQCCFKMGYGDDRRRPVNVLRPYSNACWRFDGPLAHASANASPPPPSNPRTVSRRRPKLVGSNPLAYDRAVRETNYEHGRKWSEAGAIATLSKHSRVEGDDCTALNPALARLSGTFCQPSPAALRN